MRAAERLAATETRLKAIDEAFAETRKRAAAAKKAFEEVKTKRYDLFMKAFNHISENIGGTYKDLTKSPQFPLGGQAYLDMEDSTEPYLAGLKYHAMPPLKRFRDMEHLSGGEKTIAALALLFAIHSYQPSPFFVLDEVDAALDNVNVSRVAKYVREHASPGMQFIVISLKAGFFQESETLVGVMRDQGKMTSKYLSLDVSCSSRKTPSKTYANVFVAQEVPACVGAHKHICSFVTLPLLLLLLLLLPMITFLGCAGHGTLSHFFSRWPVRRICIAEMGVPCILSSSNIANNILT